MPFFKNATPYITAHNFEQCIRKFRISSCHCIRMNVVLDEGWKIVLNVLYGVFCVWVQVVCVLIVIC